MDSGRSAVTRRKAVARMLKAIHAQKSREACARKAEEAADVLESMRLGAAARTARDGFAETLAYAEFPPEHWHRIRTNNGIERINREIGRRTRVVGTFPDGNSALMLVTARLKYIAEHEWGMRRYPDMSKLEAMDELGGRPKARRGKGRVRLNQFAKESWRYPCDVRFLDEARSPLNGHQGAALTPTFSMQSSSP